MELIPDWLQFRQNLDLWVCTEGAFSWTSRCSFHSELQQVVFITSTCPNAPSFCSGTSACSPPISLPPACPPWIFSDVFLFSCPETPSSAFFIQQGLQTSWWKPQTQICEVESGRPELLWGQIFAKSNMWKSYVNSTFLHSITFLFPQLQEWCFRHLIQHII